MPASCIRTRVRCGDFTSSFQIPLTSPPLLMLLCASCNAHAPPLLQHRTPQSLHPLRSLTHLSAIGFSPSNICVFLLTTLAFPCGLDLPPLLSCPRNLQLLAAAERTFGFTLQLSGFSTLCSPTLRCEISSPFFFTIMPMGPFRDHRCGCRAMINGRGGEL